jgi:hypothetical protein
MTTFQTADRYTVLTESKATVPFLVAERFKGATYIPQTGVYDGQPEASVSVVLINADAEPDFEARVLALAEAIRTTNRQAEVWVTKDTVTLARVQATAEEEVAA